MMMGMLAITAMVMVRLPRILLLRMRMMMMIMMRMISRRNLGGRVLNAGTQTPQAHASPALTL